jgi:cbb3-type cytochrome oxidase cytochrome c subunit
MFRLFKAASLPVLVTGAALCLAGCTPDGAALAEQEGCLECHRFQGRGGYLGPDLTAVTARRSPEWIRQQLKNPRKNEPGSRMPPYDYLSSREIRAIISYLAGEE